MNDLQVYSTAGAAHIVIFNAIHGHSHSTTEEPSKPMTPEEQQQMTYLFGGTVAITFVLFFIIWWKS